MNVIVKVLSEDHGISFIEWIEGDMPRRGTIPSGAINGANVDDALLSLAVPYGIEWEVIVPDTALQHSSEVLARELRRHGFWTVADLRARPQVAIAVIQDVLAVNYHMLLSYAEAHLRIVDAGK